MEVVVLDTTELQKSQFLAGNDLVRLSAYLKSGDLECAIPETALLEHLRHIRKEISKKRSEIAKSLARLARLSDFDLSPQEDDSTSGGSVCVADDESLMASYESKYRMRLNELGISLAPTPPTLTVDAIRDRDLANLKPFGDKNKGLRDTIIWETVKELSTRPDVDRVHFITGNISDFNEKSGALHADLVAELEATDAVAAWVNLAEFNEAWASQHVAPSRTEDPAEPPAGEKATPYAPAPSGGHEPAVSSEADAQSSVGEQVRAGVAKVIDGLYGENIAVEDPEGRRMGGLPFGGVEIPSEFDEPYIAGVDYAEDDVIWNIDEIIDTTLLGTAWVTAHVDIETYIYKGDVAYLEDLEVVDADWNDHMVLARYPVEVLLNFELQWEHGVHDSMSVQMVGAEPIPVPEH